jgi:iron complex transport system substrate-binding protein
MDSSRRISGILFLACLLLAVALVLYIRFGADSNRECTIAGEVLPFKHSALLSVVDCDGYSVADVKNPWGDGLLRRYILVPKNAELPGDLPEGVILRTPLERVVVFSGVHAAMLEELGAGGAVVGVCDAEYIYTPMTAAGLRSGRVVDCGSSVNVDSERLLVAAPEAVFVLPYENGGYGKLERFGIPLVECADYMETSPLACAEWIRFYGRLVGKGNEADSIFSSVAFEYEELAGLVSGVEERPKLLCELKSSSAWYVPGGGSTMGRMYADAGADYAFASYGSSGSVPLAFEVVLDKAADADVWLIKYNSSVDKTYSSLVGEYAGYSHFKAFKSRNIYVCNCAEKRLFEERTFHPEKLLKELVALFHPSLLPDYRPRYYEKMRLE